MQGLSIPLKHGSSRVGAPDMIDAIVIIFGLIIGSFLTVCVYRIPLGRELGIAGLQEEEGLEEGAEDDPEEGSEQNSPHFEKPVNIWYPRRSFCPHCGGQLRWFHNLPFFGYLSLLGRCAFCKERISWKYPTIELLTAGAAWLSYSSFDPQTAAIAFIFSAALIVLSFIDLEYFILPNVITYPGIALGIVFGLLQTFFHWFEAPPFVANIEQGGIGILCGAGILLAISLFYTFVRRKQGLGLGDVKLLAMTGAFFGFPGAFYTIFVGSLIGSLVGISLMLIGRGKWSSYLPFGPYLAVANLLYLFYGQELTRFLGAAALRSQGY
jgi:leader peptidase (prepilin peptidase)/N-methyltransferase